MRLQRPEQLFPSISWEGLRRPGVGNVEYFRCVTHRGKQATPLVMSTVGWLIIVRAVVLETLKTHGDMLTLWGSSQ